MFLHVPKYCRELLFGLSAVALHYKEAEMLKQKPRPLVVLTRNPFTLHVMLKNAAVPLQEGWVPDQVQEVGKGGTQRRKTVEAEIKTVEAEIKSIVGGTEIVGTHLENDITITTSQACPMKD